MLQSVCFALHAQFVNNSDILLHIHIGLAFSTQTTLVMEQAVFVAFSGAKMEKFNSNWNAIHFHFPYTKNMDDVYVCLFFIIDT